MPNEQVVGQIALKMVLNDTDYKRSLSSAEKRADTASTNMAASFKKVGAAIAKAFTVAAVIKFGKDSVESAAKVQASNAQLAQTFGDLQAKAEAAMQAVADKSGVLKTRLQGVGTDIFAFAKTSGMDSAAALGMMQEALQVTADSAAYYDRSLEDTAESLKSFLKGNYANDAALGLSCTETTRNAAANRLYGKSFKDLSEAQKQLTLLQMVKDANQLSGAMGQAARESNGWENVLGNLKESWNQLLAAVGKPILQGAVVVIKRLTAWISTLAQWAKAASQSLGELFGWGGEDTSQTAANTAQTAASIAESVDNQNALTQAVTKTNAEVKRGIAGFDKLNLLTKSTVDSGGDSSGSKNSGEAKGLGDVYGGKVELDTGDADSKLNKLKEKIGKILEPFVTFFNKYIKPIYEKVKQKIDELCKKFSEWLDKLNLEPLVNSIEFLFETLEPLIDSLLTLTDYLFTNVILPVATVFIEKILPTIISLIGHIINMLKPIIDTAFELLKPIWENIIKPALDKIAEWFQKIGDKIGPKLEELGQKIGGVLEKLKPIVDFLTTVLGPVIEKLMDSIGGNVMSTLVNIIDTVGSIMETLGGLIDFITGVFTGDWDKAWNGLKEIFRGICNTIINIVNALWTGIYTAISSIVNGIGGLVKGLGSLFGQEWGWEMPTEAPLIPQIPPDGGTEHGGTSFAKGGIVKAPTLAVVGDNPGAGSGNPEVVAPLSKLQGMIQQSGGEDVVLLTKIYDLLKRMYELFIVMRSSAGRRSAAPNPDYGMLFDKLVEYNEIYKDTHDGVSAFA